MAFDALLRISSETGKSATTNSTGVDLSVAGRKTVEPHWVRVIVSAGAASGSDVTLTFSIDHSSDNSTWYAHSSAADQVVTITSGGSVRDRDVVWLPVATDKRYIRLTMTKGGGTLASGAWTADMTNSKPS